MARSSYSKDKSLSICLVKTSVLIDSEKLELCNLSGARERPTKTYGL